MELRRQWQDIIGRMQPLPQGAVEESMSPDAGVFIVRRSIDFTGFNHRHRGYEFIVPFGPTAPFRVEGKVLVTEHMKIFPFNPEQEHRAVKAGCHPGLLGLFFRTGYLKRLARSIAGKNNLQFVNRSYSYPQYMRYLVDGFRKETAHRQPGYRLATESLAMQMAVFLLRHTANNCTGSSTAFPATHRKAVREAIDFIHENYRRNFSLSELAAAVHLSPFHLSRLFKAETGVPPFVYLTQVKLDRARELLRFGDRSITEVCHESGFKSLSHFSRLFSATVGVTPTEFRRGAG